MAKASRKRKDKPGKKRGRKKDPGKKTAKAAKAGMQARPAGQSAVVSTTHHSPAEMVPYDETLLERSRTQWQFGDWQSLAQINRDRLQHHPDRAKLALLAAAGHLQCGTTAEAHRFVRLARDWGCGKELISRILIAGVHNSLGRAAAVAGRRDQSLRHFEQSLTTGTPGAEARLLTQARIMQQVEQLQLPELVFHHPLLPKNATGRHSVSTRTDQPHSTTTTPVGQGQAGQSAINPTTGEPSKTKDHKAENAVACSARPQPAITTPDKEKSTNGGHKFSSDANIDDFIEDITPFFYDRHITYLDIGAYIGEVFRKILSTKKVRIREAHLIEPNPESYKQLVEVAKKSGVSSCHTYQVGISNVLSTARFLAAKSMTKRLGVDLEAKEGSGIFEAECKRLDDLSSVFTDGRVNLMKLDVEGEELDVLSSADSLLAKQLVDVIYVEIGLNKDGKQQTYFGDIDAFLQERGYRIFKIYEQKNEWIEDSPLLRRFNAAYMSSKFAAANPYKLTLENYRMRIKLKNWEQ
ncbi:FkbM family methyltransferase [Desulfurivibrio alkaliphilus]|uniref:Methyltransferase FkbM family n=1 Tax=Desulfurivibrio alkaliphilus (strain DSM 19089 / UNIQEM U267 / AHT2) TaxID=589865 RepID=D6Z4Q1_DESAT|nr:FkbM family methyltransferase [Desulfurivibrio alkaliphilus]ADH86526.1 methyltransferase FkbM family [Desulfurivibrio alkaliphilus AHT 2]